MVDGAATHWPDHRRRGAGAQQVDVVDAVRPGQQAAEISGHIGLEIGMGGAGDAVAELEALSDELPQPEPSASSEAQGQTGVGHRLPSSKAMSRR